MDNIEIEKAMSEALWAAHSVFDRGKTSGSSANMSFMVDGHIYITASGSCFGTLREEDFSLVTLDGSLLKGAKPSKELPLHLHYYRKSGEIKAVIHTHGPYAALWSCRSDLKEDDAIPSYTPYLRMKLGKVTCVPYAQPGSRELFDAFEKALPLGDAYLLRNHGAIVGGKSIMDAFYCLEELEESARLACLICGVGSCSRI